MKKTNCNKEFSILMSFDEYLEYLKKVEKGKIKDTINQSCATKRI